MSSSSIPTCSDFKGAIRPYDLYYHATEKQQGFDWEILWTTEFEPASNRCVHVKESLRRFKGRCGFLDRLTEKLPQSCPPVAVNTPAFVVTGEALDQEDAMDVDGPIETNTSEESLETRCQDDEKPMDTATSDSTGSLLVPRPQDVVGPCTANQLWRWAPYEHVRMPQLESVRGSRWVREKHAGMQKWRRDEELRAKKGSELEFWQNGSGAFGAVGGSLAGY